MSIRLVGLICGLICAAAVISYAYFGLNAQLTWQFWVAALVAGLIGFASPILTWMTKRERNKQDGWRW